MAPLTRREYLNMASSGKKKSRRGKSNGRKRTSTKGGRNAHHPLVQKSFIRLVEDLADCEMTTRSRNALINTMNNVEVNALKDVIFDFLTKRFTVSPHIVNELRPHRRALEKFSTGLPRSVERNRKFLKQKGGFLPLLLPLVSTILSQAIPRTRIR